MRILVLTYEYPPIGGGGGRAAQDICRELAEDGHQICVLTAHFNNLPQKENQDEVQVVRLKSGRNEPFRAGLRAMGGYIWASFWNGLRWICREKPDVIHAHFAVPTGVSAWLLSRLTGVPYVLTVHLGDVPGGVPEKTSRWFRWIYPFTPPIWESAAKVVAVSQFTRELACKVYPVDPVVIPNGVNLAMLDPGEIICHQPPRILFAGRLMPQKNPVGLIRVLAHLTDMDWECVLIGDGPLRNEVEAAIRISNLQNRIRLTGWIKPEEVLDWMRKSDILFMPSLSEGLPVVGVQALALGLALVVSRAGGFPELVQPGENGFLADAQDDLLFVSHLRRLLSDRELLLKCRRASRNLANQFDLTRVGQAYSALFLAIVKAKNDERLSH